MSGSESRLRAALELAGLGIPLVPAHHPVRGGGLARCSCGRVDCSAPGRHVALGLSPQDASIYPGQIRRWWGGVGAWNLAVVAGQFVDVVELAYPRPAGEVASWLGEHEVEPGPVIDLHGPVRFLTTVRADPARQRQPVGSGWLQRPAHGELVLVPPSVVEGWPLSWLVGPHLPFAEAGRLWHALSVLPPPELLAAWAGGQQHHNNNYHDQCEDEGDGG